MTVNQVIAHNNQYQNPIAIIFTHDFAKAFWGENFSGEEVVNMTFSGDLKRWQYHLQQMILEEEPLQYLKQFLVK
jgi:hypothetical protein